MILIVTPDTILNRGALEVRRIPKPILGRNITLYPREGLLSGLTLRLIFEHALPRYLIALWPFPVAMREKGLASVAVPPTSTEIVISESQVLAMKAA